MNSTEKDSVNDSLKEETLTQRARILTTKIRRGMRNDVKNILGETTPELLNYQDSENVIVINLTTLHYA
jgi:hypothetical protein